MATAEVINRLDTRQSPIKTVTGQTELINGVIIETKESSVEVVMPEKTFAILCDDIYPFATISQLPGGIIEVVLRNKKEFPDEYREEPGGILRRSDGEPLAMITTKEGNKINLSLYQGVEAHIKNYYGEEGHVWVTRDT